MNRSVSDDGRGRRRGSSVFPIVDTPVGARQGPLLSPALAEGSSGVWSERARWAQPRPGSLTGGNRGCRKSLPWAWMLLSVRLGSSAFPPVQMDAGFQDHKSPSERFLLPEEASSPPPGPDRGSPCTQGLSDGPGSGSPGQGHLYPPDRQVSGVVAGGRTD